MEIGSVKNKFWLVRDEEDYRFSLEEKKAIIDHYQFAILLETEEVDLDVARTKWNDLGKAGFKNGPPWTP